MQVAVVLGGVVLLAVAAFVFLNSGGSSNAKPKSVSGNVKLVAGKVTSANGGGLAQLPDDAKNKIMQGVGAYVDGGLVGPDKSGKPPRDLSSIFDQGAAAQANGPDKAVVFEPGTPKRTGNFKPQATPVEIVALSDANGQFVLATAGFTYTAEIGVKGGTLKTTRITLLTFIADNGAWKITGYDISVARQGAGVETPPTSAAKR